MRFLVVVALLASIYPVKRILEHVARKHQFEWAAVQGKRCSKLGGLLYQFHEQHGTYPKNLHELVDAGIIDEALYRELMFQQKSSSTPKDWKYHTPKTFGDVALFSGDPVTTWNCPIASYLIRRADGSTMVFEEEKLAEFKKHFLQPGKLAE